MYQLPDFPADFIYPDINVGLDYEREISRLQGVAGQAFRAYWKAKHDPQATPDTVEDLRAAYARAHNAIRDIKPSDYT